MHSSLLQPRQVSTQLPGLSPPTESNSTSGLPDPDVPGYPLRSMITAFFSAFSRLRRDIRRRWLLLFPLTFLATAVETACTIAMVGVLSLISTPDALPNPSRLVAALRLSAGTVTPRAAAILCALAAVLYFMRGLVRLLEVHSRIAAGCTSTAQLSQDLFRAYLRAPYAWHLKRNPLQLLNNLMFATQHAFQLFLSSMFGATIESLTVAALVLVLCVTMPIRFLAAGCLVAALCGLSFLLTQRSLRTLGDTRTTIEGQLTAHVSQTLTSLKEVRVMGLEELATATADDAWARMADLQIRRGTLGGTPRVALEVFFIAGGFVFAALFCSHGTPLQSVLPALGLYVYIAARIFPSLSAFIYHVGEIRYCAGALISLNEEWRQLEAVQATMPEPLVMTPGPAIPISFCDVGFRYDERPEPALRGVSFELEVGQWLGVVGSSGAGKSTLVDLVMGLLDPTSGEIRVAGRPRPRSRPARGRIGYVPQNAFMGDTSLLGNVVPGVPLSAIDRDRAFLCLQRAQLGEFVKSLPRGLDTRLGASGVGLSSGQRQRVALARALYHEPELLVLDEATGALDRFTEEAVLESLQALTGTTVVMVTHRMAAVRRCDHILVLSGGQVAARGRFNQLLADSPEFRRMAELDPALLRRRSA
jgi:ABC-type multidrug transport system fused ATPase/permease subunit